MLSSVSFIVMFLIMIIIPTLLYTFLFLINCPPNPFECIRRRHRSDHVEGGTPTGPKAVDGDEDENGVDKDKNSMELVIASSSTLGKDVTTTECPVCLAVFVEGEELRQLKLCKHLFHRSCIDKWISTHCNCPVCRAFVRNQTKPNKERESNRVLMNPRDGDRHDLWQGLPDSAGLV